MNDQYGKHYSVLKNECLAYLTEREENDLIIADLTFGAGGHSLAMASLPQVKKVYSVDQDPDALKNGFDKIKTLGLGEKCELIETNFVDFPDKISNDLRLDGVLLDLGVSSHHFDTAERGFSFRFDASLDMRMNPQSERFKPASSYVNELSASELERIFRDYGEEKYAHRISLNICEKRNESPILTTKQLEDIIFHSYPKAERFSGRNPATKVFQALRIHVNQELEVLSEVLGRLIPLLKMNGRLAVISFHSLEDRIVKLKFKEFEANQDLPCQNLTKKPIVPSAQEILDNSRSRSAKLRVIERVIAKKGKNKYPKPAVKE